MSQAVLLFELNSRLWHVGARHDIWHLNSQWGQHFISSCTVPSQSRNTMSRFFCQMSAPWTVVISGHACRRLFYLQCVLKLLHFDNYCKYSICSAWLFRLCPVLFDVHHWGMSYQKLNCYCKSHKGSIVHYITSELKSLHWTDVSHHLNWTLGALFKPYKDHCLNSVAQAHL